MEQNLEELKRQIKEKNIEREKKEIVESVLYNKLQEGLDEIDKIIVKQVQKIKNQDQIFKTHQENTTNIIKKLNEEIQRLQEKLNEEGHNRKKRRLEQSLKRTLKQIRKAKKQPNKATKHTQTKIPITTRKREEKKKEILYITVEDITDVLEETVEKHWVQANLT